MLKHGQTHEKEADGRELLEQAIRADGRLAFEQTFEAARADFCVFFPGMSHQAVGVQLKTCWTLQKHYRKWRYVFGGTNGYAGLMMIFMGLTDGNVRVWVIPGTHVTASQIHINVEGTRGYDWDLHEVQISDVAQALITSFQSNDIKLKTLEEHVRPTDPNRAAEYDAFQHLRLHLPLDFRRPRAENQSHDYLAAGFMWQMKLAFYADSYDNFRVVLHKYAGRGTLTRQYEAFDFDWLAISLRPEDERLRNIPQVLYLIPMRVLVSRGLAGKAGAVCGNVTLYPHRPCRGRNAHWTEAYRIFLTSPAEAIAQYRQLAAAEASMT